MTTGPKFTSPELDYLNSPPPYQYLNITDPLMKEDQRRRKKPFASGKAVDMKTKFKNMTLRDYIGPEHFRYADSQTVEGNKLKPNGNAIYNSILDRVRKQGGAKSESASKRAKTAGSISVSHQSMLRTYAKRDPAASPATHAYAMEALDRNLDRFKQILKKQVIQHLKKLKLGIEFEEICYNI